MTVRSSSFADNHADTHVHFGDSKWAIHLRSPDIHTLALDHASYLHYHRGVSRLRRALESRIAIPDAEQRMLLRDGVKAERSHKRAVATALDTISSNPEFFFGTGGAVQAICSGIDQLRKFASPSAFTPEVQDAIKHTGISRGEFRHYYDVLFGTKNHPHLKECLEGLGPNIASVVKQTRGWTGGSHFPESEAELRKLGIINISGQDDPVPYIIGAAAVVVGVAVVVASGGTAAGVIPGVVAIAGGTASTGATIGGAIAVGGAVLLGTEAYQDATDTQDGKWLYKYKGHFSEP